MRHPRVRDVFLEILFEVRSNSFRTICCGAGASPSPFAGDPGGGGGSKTLFASKSYDIFFNLAAQTLNSWFFGRVSQKWTELQYDTFDARTFLLQAAHATCLFFQKDFGITRQAWTHQQANMSWRHEVHNNAYSKSRWGRFGNGLRRH